MRKLLAEKITDEKIGNVICNKINAIDLKLKTSDYKNAWCRFVVTVNFHEELFPRATIYVEVLEKLGGKK